MNQSETTSAAGGGETRMYEAGRITGHYSDPDGSPDVGYSVGLGDGKMLWIGEISEHLFAETGAAGADLGGSGGQWFVLFGQERGATQVLGKAMPGIDADALCTAIAAALAAPTAKGGTEVPADPLVAYLERQWAWSKETFGPALRTKGIVQHITKELREIGADPHDLAEWVDVIILAMDGFWRHGGKPSDLLPAMQAKQDRNFARTWPDWRTMGEDQAIEHDRSGDASPPPPAGAAGDGSGDLGALSAAASPGEWSVWAEKIMGAHDAIVELREQVEQTRPIGGHLYLLNADGKCPATTGCGPCSEANATFIVALVNAYRSGRLIEASAPTPDLGAQGEPVARDDPREPGYWKHQQADYLCQRDTESDEDWIDRLRRHFAPAAPRTWSGVSAEEIASPDLRSQAKALIEAAGWKPGDQMHGMALLELMVKFGQQVREQASEERCNYPDCGCDRDSVCADGLRVLALTAQAPRDGGETQGGWRLVPDEPTQAMWAAYRNADGGNILFHEAYRAMLAAAPTPPSGVETIRQDIPSGVL